MFWKIVVLVYICTLYYVDVFFPLSLPWVLPDLPVYMSDMADVLYEAVPFASTGLFWLGSSF
jgi:hypothetical protein